MERINSQTRLDWNNLELHWEEDWCHEGEKRPFPQQTGSVAETNAWLHSPLWESVIWWAASGLFKRKIIWNIKRSYSWELGKQGWHAWKMCGKLFWQYVWNSVRKILCSLNRPTCSEPTQHNLIFGASPVMQYYFFFCTVDAQSEFRHHTIILWIYMRF